MSFEKAFIPYGAYWSSPFCRWQGSLGEINSIKLAAGVASKALSQRDISPEVLDSLSWVTPCPSGTASTAPPGWPG